MRDDYFYFEYEAGPPATEAPSRVWTSSPGFGKKRYGGEAVATVHCPSCGKRVEYNKAGECPHCGEEVKLKRLYETMTINIGSGGARKKQGPLILALCAVGLAGWAALLFYFLG